jgi:serine/threonine protein kinase
MNSRQTKKIIVFHFVDHRGTWHQVRTYGVVKNLAIVQLGNWLVAYLWFGQHYLLTVKEVWAKLPYNSASDVYSFGVVLYEMIALERAFHFCPATTSEEFAVQVFHNAERPSIDDIRAPPSIKALLPFCWNDNPQYRYDMANVNLTLRRELILLRNGDESNLPNFSRRRSTFIFRPNTTKSRDGSFASYAESVHSILSAHSSSSAKGKRASIVNMNALNLSVHSMNLSFHSGKRSEGT